MLETPGATLVNTQWQEERNAETSRKALREQENMRVPETRQIVKRNVPDRALFGQGSAFQSLLCPIGNAAACYAIL